LAAQGKILENLREEICGGFLENPPNPPNPPKFPLLRYVTWVVTSLEEFTFYNVSMII